VDVGSAGSYYKLSAVDVNGNESTFSLLAPNGTTSVGDASLAFALEGVRPNPLRGGAVGVDFMLPVSAPARLDLVDVVGRRVATWDLGAFGPGQHHLALTMDEKLGSGIYWMRLTQAGRVAVARAVVVE
jgi:hypothetical protein